MSPPPPTLTATIAIPIEAITVRPVWVSQRTAERLFGLPPGAYLRAIREWKLDVAEAGKLRLVRAEQLEAALHARSSAMGAQPASKPRLDAAPSTPLPPPPANDDAPANRAPSLAAELGLERVPRRAGGRRR